MESDNQPVQSEIPEPADIPPPRRRRVPRVPYSFGPPFWTITGILSLAVNIILILVVVVLSTQLFSLKKLVEDQVLGGLFNNFVLMDQAHIKTTIPVSTNVAAKFDLPLKTNTTVVLTEDTTIKGARVNLSTGGLTISDAPANIVLPAGTNLPIALDLIVPVDQMIPVNLIVEVDIPLAQTELHQPFVGLQEVVRPYYKMLKDLPDSWAEIFTRMP